MQNPVNRIQSDAVMLYFSTGRMRTRRKLSSDAVQTDIDKDLLHISKDILESPELDEIQTFDNAIKSWVRERCLPSPLKGKGVMILPVRLIEQVMAKVEQAELDRRPLIEKFLAKYEEAKEAARPKLGSGFEEADYPSVDRVRNLFFFEVQLWELNTPGKLASINRALYEREVAKMNNIWSEAQKTVGAVLMTEFHKLTAHLADRLQPGPDGKKKVLKSSVVTNLQQWIDLFQVRNLTNDEELVAHVDRARALIAGVDARTIKDSDHLRVEMAADFGMLAAQMNEMIVNAGVREVVLDGEE